MSFLNGLVKSSGNEFASIVTDGTEADVTGFVDTGSYAFNALVSGSLKGGIASNKIIGLSGESATGKTYFALGIAGQFLQDNKDGVILYFDTEQAVSSDMIKSHGLNPARVAVFPVATVEAFRFQLLQVLDNYSKLSKAEQKPIMVILDSLGMLSTSKEMNDSTEGKETRDMTRSQVIKGTFRTITLKLGKHSIPLIVTNHTYTSMGMFPTQIPSGGSGLQYAASTIIMLSKKKHKVDDEVVGSIIHCKTYKSRLTKENRQVDVLLNYDTGLDRYYGLVELGLSHGIFKKVSNKIQFPNGTTAFEGHVIKNPKKFFTDDVLKSLEEAAEKEFKYGGGEDPITDSIEEEKE
jgi:RecA/RadA recombinase